jgi:glycosyltransferase involved in cell wall biosynthesis
VVASDISGYSDVMTPETAIGCPAGDPSALADAVESLLADEPKRQAMGSAGRQLAQERYAWDAIGPRLLRIYERVAA